MIVELLQFRDLIEKHFADEYNRQLTKVKAAIVKQGKIYKERIVSNYMKLTTCVSLLADKFDLPFKYDEFFDYCQSEAVRLSNIIDSTNALAAFWRIVEFLLDAGEIEYGFDFEILETDEVKIRVEDQQDVLKTFMGKQKLLFIRFSTIHQLYTERLSRKGEQFINMETLALYLKTEPGFIGVTRAHSFHSRKYKKRLRTSAYVFEYGKMSLINLERVHYNDDPDPDGAGGAVVHQNTGLENTNFGAANPDAAEDLPF